MPLTEAILVVSDEPSSLPALNQVLGADGYAVRTVDSGELARLSATGPLPDLILLDLHGPDADGLAMCQRLRMEAWPRGIPVVVVIAADSANIRAQLLQMGGVDFVVRPFEPAEMLTRVHVQLELRRMRAELERQAVHLQQADEQLRSEVAGRRQTEDVLRENAALIRSISTNMPNGMLYQIIHTPDGGRRFTYLSEAVRRFYGCSPAEAMADPMRIYGQVVEEDRRRAYEEEERASKAFVTFTTELRFRNPSGDIRWSYVASSPRLLDNGSTCWDGIEIDITERKRLEERLRQSQKMDAIGQLAGGIAHDFNNQLLGIMGYTEMLVESLNDPELKGYARRILAASERAADLTSNLLSFARKGHYLSVPNDVHRIIAETVEMLRRSLEKHIHLVEDLGAPRTVVVGDPAQLESVLLNLAINARDAMPHGGTITFATAQVRVDEKLRAAHNLDLRDDDYLLISVIDTGCGMTDEVKKHLFEPFFTTKPVGKGTGMGLASVYGTVKGHQGAILIDSEVGRGTTVSIYLPLTAMDTSLTTDRLASHTAAGGLRILVVDDEALARDMLTTHLRSAGYVVTVTADGWEAVDVYRRRWREIALVLLDLVMPVMGGRDAFTAIKRINPAVRVILNSGFSIDNEAGDIMAQGAAGFLQKPFTKNALLQKIVEVMGGVR